MRFSTPASSRLGKKEEMVVSELLGKEARRLLGLDQVMTPGGVTEEHQKYLLWHRSRVFRRIGS